jgi:tRNA A-37 threonylcarbamoyl transferase component Bud32
MPSDNCPERPELKQYVQGTLPAESVGHLEAHVATCVSCEETLCDLDDSADLFLVALRKGAEANEERYLNEPEFKAAVVAAHQNIVAADNDAFSEKLKDKLTEKESNQLADLPFSQLGQYELISEIGRGGMGIVYKARHTKLDRIVALKVLPAEKLSNPQAMARFEREMSAVGRLQHPNIVQASDAGDIDGIHYLAMEYVEGLNLSDLIKKHGPLPISDACELIRQVAVGLQHAFEFGLVHRDIKPGNLMLTPQGHVKLLDLG